MSKQINRAIGVSVSCLVWCLMAPPVQAGLFDKINDAVKAAGQTLDKGKSTTTSPIAAVTDDDDETDSVAVVAGCDLAIAGSPYKTWKEASEHRIREVKDGDPVYLHVKLDKAVENYLFNVGMPGTSWADVKAIGIEITSTDRRVAAYAENYFVPTAAELKAKELVVNLAPGEQRRLDLSAWLKLIGAGHEGTWPNEVRIFTRDNKNGEKTYLGRAPLTASVESGVKKYYAMYQNYLKVQEAGDPATNSIPTRGEIQDAAVAKAAAAATAKALGVPMLGFYLTGDGWFEDRTPAGFLEKVHTSAVSFYKNGAKCMFGVVNVDKWAHNNSITTQITVRKEITCERMAAALK